MPNRIVRDGILTSEAVSSLSWAEEVFYRRLMSVADDHGRFHAAPKLIRAACYPLLIDKVSDADIGKWLTSCVTAALVSVYPAADGKRYLQITKFGQQVRSASKFPGPVADGLLAIDSSREQLPANAHLDVFVFEGVSEDERGARKRAQPVDISAIELPSWLDRDVWALWVDDRKARRKPITERAAAMQIAKLDEYRQQGHSPQSVIAHSVAGGYQGLFPPSKQIGQQASITAPCTDRRGDDFLTQQAERAKEATKPPAALKALLGGRAQA